MEKTLYQDGVLVDAPMLNRTETSKSSEILRNRKDWNTRGVLSGGVVSRHSTNPDRINIQDFSGYTPNGEYVSGFGALNQTLASYTAGTWNYVLAVYTETTSEVKSHETDGYSYPTKISPSYRLVIITEAAYAALPVTSSSMAANSKDRSLILAKVRAEGTGIAINQIELPTDFGNILYADPVDFEVISGVKFLTIGGSTPVGVGTLKYDPVVNFPNFTFYWKSNGNTYGPGVEVDDDTTVILEDSSGNWVKLNIILSQLPTSGIIIEEPATIYNLYDQDIPRVSSEDNLHRSYIGSGVITPTNPHGLSHDDISDGSGGSLQEHQDVLHCTGIWRGSNSSILRGNVFVPHPSNDILSILFPTVNNLYYINGNKLSSLSNSTMDFPHSNYGLGCDLYEIYVTDNGAAYPHKRASFPVPRLVTGVWLIDMSDDHPAGDYTLSCTVSGPSYDFSWGGGKVVNVIHDPVDQGVIIKLESLNPRHWVSLYVRTELGGPFPDATLPGSSQSETVTVYSAPDPDQNMKILSAPYWYDGTKGTFGYRFDLDNYPNDASRGLVDKRIFGTLSEENMSDGGLDHVSYDPQDELHSSGVLISRDGLFTEFRTISSSLSLTVTGGSYYCRGKRLSVDNTTLSLPDDKEILIYASHSGAIQYLNVTDDFASSVIDAMKYIVGDSLKDIKEWTKGYSLNLYAEMGVPLRHIVTSSGSILKSKDICKNVNSGVTPWSVGSRGGTINIHLHSAAQFSDLWSAFLWCNVERSLVSNNSRFYEFKTSGVSYIDDGYEIDQPKYTRVVSNGDELSRVEVRDPITRDYAWKLDDGCEVDNVWIVNVSVGKAIFGSIGANVSVKNCSLRAVQPGSTSRDAYIFRLGSSPGRLNLTIENNKIVTPGAVFYDTGYSDIYNNFRFVNNKVNYYDENIYVSTSPLISLRNLRNSEVSGNVIGKSNWDTVPYRTDALRLTSCSGTSVRGNNIQVYNSGSHIAGSFWYGINAVSCSDVSVEGNNLFCPDGHLPLCNGIGTSNCVSNMRICNNSVRSFSIGIDVYNSNLFGFNGFSICNNNVYNLNGLSSDSYAGISVRYQSSSVGGSRTIFIKNLNIDNNVVSGLDNSNNYVPFVYGVVFDISNENNHLSNLTNVSINGNSISDLNNNTSHIDGAGSSGIFVRMNPLRAGDNFSNMSISNNKISRIVSTPPPFLFFTGIKVSLNENSSYSQNFVGLSIDSNEINLSSPIMVLGTPMLSQGLYIESFYTNLFNNSISDNKIQFITPSGADIATGAISVESTNSQVYSSILNNSLLSSGTAIYCYNLSGGSILNNYIGSYYKGVELDECSKFSVRANTIVISRVRGVGATISRGSKGIEVGGSSCSHIDIEGNSLGDGTPASSIDVLYDTSLICLERGDSLNVINNSLKFYCHPSSANSLTPEDNLSTALIYVGDVTGTCMIKGNNLDLTTTTCIHGISCIYDPTGVTFIGVYSNFIISSNINTDGNHYYSYLIFKTGSPAYDYRLLDIGYNIDKLNVLSGNNIYPKRHISYDNNVETNRQFGFYTTTPEWSSF
jgi:hypothetical protein